VAKIGIFKQNVQNTKTFILLKLLHWFQSNFAKTIKIKEHQVYFNGGSSMCQINPRWWTVTILQKKIKSPNLGNGSTEHYEIWHSDVERPLYSTGC